MKINGLRWLMIGLIFLATVINYIDRQTVSVLKTSISQDLGLSNADYAAVQNSFLLFYGISQMVSGRLYDVVGTRLGFVFSIVVWSFAALRTPRREPRRPSVCSGACSGSVKPATGRAPQRSSVSGCPFASGRWAWGSSTPAPRSVARFAASHRLAGHDLRLADDVRRHRRLGFRLAGAVARGVSDAGAASMGDGSRARAYPRWRAADRRARDRRGGPGGSAAHAIGRPGPS